MPYFAFRVEDAQGQPRTGKVQADSAEEARALLERRGLRVVSVGNPSPVVAAPAPVPKPTEPVRIRTRRGSHKARMFLYTQLESMTRAGMNMHLMLQQLASSPYRRYHESLRDGAAMVQQGASLADVMDRYPDLYLASDAATVRVGETAGRLPEALGQLVAQAQSAHSYGWWLAFVRGWFWIMPVLGYVGFLFQRAMFGTIDRQDAAGGTLPPVGTLVEETSRQFVASLPWLGIAIAVFFAARAVWYSARLAGLRHALAAKLPVAGAMIRAESLSRFYWALSTALRAGIAPFTAYRLAADAVPNQAMASQLRAALGVARENTPLSTIVRESGVVPADSISLIMTGEQTGETPGLLDRMEAAEANQKRFLDPIVKRALISAGTVLAGIVVAFVLIYWYKAYWQGFIDRMNAI